ncbi:MAG: hypothetical protein ACI4EA_05735 [Candidatus Ornithomonoglobus sp.]
MNKKHYEIPKIEMKSFDEEVVVTESKTQPAALKKEGINLGSVIF